MSHYCLPLHGLTGLSDGWGRSGEILFGEGRGRVEGLKYLLGEVILAITGRAVAPVGSWTQGKLAQPTISPRFSIETHIWMFLDTAARMRGLRLVDVVAGIGISGDNPNFNSRDNVIRIDPYNPWHWELLTALHEVIHAEDGLSSVLEEFNSVDMQLRKKMLGYAFREALTEFEAVITYLEWFNERVPLYPPPVAYDYAKDQLEPHDWNHDQILALWQLWIRIRNAW